MAERSIAFKLPVERAKIREFALAVGEDNPIFFDADAARRAGFSDVVAPPTFSVTQMWQLSREEREARLGANLDHARVLHAEQEFVYKRLPVAGETLDATMRVFRDVTKQGRRGGELRFVTYESRFNDAADEEVLRALYTLVQTSKDPGE
ncbi:MAG: MaoC family dehydratase N-terminal domain-containing protein [Actinomycetota bacterium]|nr:MaoC family dehydratase N-terminal domain-containing protein [Actinomycetota bacterium]